MALFALHAHIHPPLHRRNIVTAEAPNATSMHVQGKNANLACVRYFKIEGMHGRQTKTAEQQQHYIAHDCVTGELFLR